MCFEWFTKGQHDLESDVQQQLFKEKILKLEPYEITMNGERLCEELLRRSVSGLVCDTAVNVFSFPQVSICSRRSLRTLICVTIASNARELNWSVHFFIRIYFLINDALIISVKVNHIFIFKASHGLISVCGTP